MNWLNRALSLALAAMPPFVKPASSEAENVHYGPLPLQYGDLYLLDKGVRPCVLLIHGGGWQAGDEEGYSGTARRLNLAGYHAFAIRYRLTDMKDPTTWWNAQLQDVQLAMRWLRANSGRLRIDPDRIAVSGGSAGGHLALFLGMLDKPMKGDMSEVFPGFSSKAQAVIDICGPTDMTEPPMWSLLKDNGLALFGGVSYEENPELYLSASPVVYVDPSTAPVCIVHGRADTVVPFSQATELHAVLSAHGVDTLFIEHEGDHGMSGFSALRKLWIELRTINFISRYLRPSPFGVF